MWFIRVTSFNHILSFSRIHWKLPCAPAPPVQLLLSRLVRCDLCNVAGNQSCIHPSRWWKPRAPCWNMGSRLMKFCHWNLCLEFIVWDLCSLFAIWGVDPLGLDPLPFKSKKKPEVHVWLWYHKEAVMKQKKLRAWTVFSYQSNTIFLG